jgi:hypothetical protein
MRKSQDIEAHVQDPLGLRELPMLTPEEDGWAVIQQALEANQRRRGLLRTGGWLAAAASLVMVVAVVTRLAGPETQGPPAEQSLATTSEPAASMEQDDTLDSLIAMSQTLERQVRGLREGSGSMPAASAVYVAELEDLVAQVDNELSFSPNSVNLWGQRVNLLLDLAQIYQQQWERDYGRMASL